MITQSDPDSFASTQELLRERAYQFYETRGREDGHDLEDWLRAEAEILGKRARHRRIDLRGRSYVLVTDYEHVDTAVVFAHGFFGHPEKTWIQFQTLIDTATSEGLFPWWAASDVFFYSYDDVSQFGPNAAELLTFVRRVYPVPQWKNLQCCEDDPDNNHAYKYLMLVGHSEGGVLVRAAILRLVQEYNETPADRLEESLNSDPVLDANLRLYAPAIWGSLMSGWKGVLLRSPILGEGVKTIV